MRANLMKWLLAVMATCSLCAVNEIYAQGGDLPKPGGRIQTRDRVGYITDTLLPDGRIKVTYVPPAIEYRFGKIGNFRFALKKARSMEAGDLVQKLCRFVSPDSAVTQKNLATLFGNVDPT